MWLEFSFSVTGVGESASEDGRPTAETLQAFSSPHDQSSVKVDVFKQCHTYRVTHLSFSRPFLTAFRPSAAVVRIVTSRRSLGEACY